VRGIIGELKAADGFTIVDMEAGLELFGRGTPGASDLLIEVIEPSLWSIQTAMRITDLARELGIPQVVAVANKVRDEADVAWIRQAVQPLGVSLIGVVPYDPAVSLADRTMRSLLDVAPDSEAAQAIGGIAAAIERMAGADAAPATPAAGGNGDDGCPWVVDTYTAKEAS
jgi:CO dehydrogenase maturation factor